MRHKLIIILLIATVHIPTSILFAQKYSVRCKVIDTNGLPEIYATCRIFSNNDTTKAVRLGVTTNVGISDSDYDAFVERLFASQDRDIEPGSTKLLDQLERTMRLENMPADAYSKIKELRELFKPKKAEFLQTFRKPIMRWLEAEICMNYYGDAGALEARSLVDSEVKAALELLNDPDRYKAILAPPAKKAK